MHLTKRIFTRAGTAGGAVALAAASVAGLTALTGASASAQPTSLNVVYAIPVLGGWGQESVSIESDAPATVAPGADFTDTITPSPYFVPNSETVAGQTAVVNFFQGVTWIIPIPAGATYVSSSVDDGGVVSWPAVAATSTTPAVAAGSVPYTVTYCTAAGTGCTATADSTSFGGNTTTPYLELATPGYGTTTIAADELPALATVSFPDASIVLAASGAAGATVQPAVSEYDAAGNATLASLGLTLTEPVATWPAAVLTTAEQASGQPIPAPVATPLSTTTITTPPLVPPTVTAVSPNTGVDTGGTSITITGTGFTNGATVTVGTNDATGVTVNSATSITATTPAGTDGAADVVVTDSNGQSATSSADQFTYTAPPLVPPTVTAVSPNTGVDTGGTSITITGTGFTNGATVTVGTNDATGVTVNSATSITATTPAGTDGAADVVVTDSNGQSATSSADQFTYTPPVIITTTTTPTPLTVTSVTPGGVAPDGGTLLTIDGTGFASGATVTVGGQPATDVTVVSSTEITAVAPAGTAGTMADVIVAEGSVQSSTSSADQVTYLPIAAIGGVVLMGLIGGLFVLEQRRRRHAAQNS